MLIKNVRIINPANQLDRIGSIEISGGKIRRVEVFDEAGRGAGGEEKPNGGGQAEKGFGEVIDGTGFVAAPGFIDVHVHFRDPGFTYKEDIRSGAAAAARGGFTTVVCMANTKPAVDNVETLRYVLEEGKKTGIHILQAAAVTKGLGGKELTDMETLKANGAAGFTDDGIPLLNDSLLMEAMREAARLHVPLSLHEENPAFIAENGINHGDVSGQMGLYGSPAVAEDSLVARDCMLALHTGVTLDIQHISSVGAVRMVKLVKELGAKVWAEVTPHHFTLTEEAVLTHGTLAKMNPPLRTEADRQAILKGLRDGSIDLIATDHAPHSAEEKDQPFAKAPSGIIGLETALGLAITELVRTGYLSLMELIEKMSLNPARLYQLEEGSIEAGKPADLVVFHPDEEWTVDGFSSKSSNSPFTGRRLFGKVKYTICKGEVVYRDEK